MEEEEYSDDFEEESGVYEASKPASFLTKIHTEKPHDKLVTIESKTFAKRKSKTTRTSLTQKGRQQGECSSLAKWIILLDLLSGCWSTSR